MGLFGLARSGLACAEALRLGGAEIFAWDDSEAAVDAAKDANLLVSDLHDVDFAELDSLVLKSRCAAHPSGAALDGGEGQGRRD